MRGENLFDVRNNIIYNGKRVTGVKPWTNKQKLKIYWLMGLWTLFFIYLIIRMLIWEDIYLIAGEGLLMFMSFALSVGLTTSWYRKQEKINYIYEEEKT